MEAIFVKCECYGEALSVIYDAECDYYYFSYWKQGFHNGRLSWLERIKYCWTILIGSTAHADEVILDGKSVGELMEFLNNKKRDE